MNPVRNRRRIQNIYFFVVILVLAALFFWREYFENKFWAAAAFFAPARQERATPEEITALLAQILELKKENSRLENVLALAPQKIIPAKVKLGGGYLFSDSVVLDQGRWSGIENGNLVATDGGVAIGKIAETGEDWSRVKTFSSLGEKTIMRGGAAKEIIFEAIGVGAGEMRAELPKDASLQAGEILWLGEANEYIAGIAWKSHGDEGGAKNIVILSPAPLKNLADVNIILQK